MHKLSLAAALAATMLAVVPANAAGADGMAVRYHDLDLASAQGVAVLDRRIRSAASQLCEVDHREDVGRRMEARACLRDALASIQSRRDALVAATRPQRLADAAK